MTQPETSRQPGGEDTPHAPVDEHAGDPGAGRTPGETSVDDELGRGGPPEG